jgi:hypothetical protein
MVSDADIQRHDRELEKLRELTLESNDLAKSAAQSFEQVVVPAMADIDALEDRVTAMETLRSRLEGIIMFLKAGGGLLAAIAIIIEILRATGRI